jgi:HK97 family phage prohead protease
MQTKEFSLDIKGVESDGSFEGYASTFGGSPDSYGDIISPGAFAQSLVKHRREGSMPLMLFGHAHNDLPIGNWTDLSEDGKGLFAKGTLDLEDPFGSRVHRALKQKRVRGLSIGYETKKSHPDDKMPGVQFLDEIDLWEVSVVNFPANRRSLVEAVKSEQYSQLREKLAAGDLPSEREFEKGMRDAFGLSNSEAERVVRLFFKQAQGDPGVITTEPSVKRLLALTRAATAGISIRT